MAWVAFVAVALLLNEKLPPWLFFGLFASAIALFWLGGLLKDHSHTLRLKRVANGNLYLCGASSKFLDGLSKPHS